MKINWGTSIVLVLLAFISFILFFVIRMSTDNRANHDLVTEEYYKAELEYQKEIDAETNANIDAANLKVKQTSEGLRIEFPERMNVHKIKGVMSFYRPSNKHLDFDLPISLSDTHLLIPDKRFLDGRWDIKILWQYEKKEYLFKKSISY